MKVLNLPGKTGKWMPREACTLCGPTITRVKRDPRVLFMEDRDWRGRHAKPSEARKRKMRKAERWSSKYM